MMLYVKHSDGIWSLRVPMNDRAVGYSLAYLIADDTGGLHVIDPGTDSNANRQLLMRMVRSIGFRSHDIASITLTHHHPDHAGLANRLRATLHIPVALHAADVIAHNDLRRPDQRQVWARRYARWGVPDDAQTALLDLVSERAARPALTVDIELAEADLLQIGGRRMTVAHIPGHSPGSIALRAEDHTFVLVGDHVLPTVYAAIGLGASADANPVRDYLHSLNKIAVFDDHDVLPGHEYSFRGLERRCAEIAEHHLRRSRQIADHTNQPGRTPWQIAQQLSWRGGWNALSGVRLASALQQVVFHLRYQATAEGRRIIFGDE